MLFKILFILRTTSSTNILNVKIDGINSYHWFLSGVVSNRCPLVTRNINSASQRG